MEKKQIRSIIESTFEGVILEDGVSALQTQVIDKYGQGYTEKEFKSLAQKDITNNWRAIPLEDLKKCDTAHLDDRGFRYYIPAFMLAILDSYEALSEKVTSILFCLCPDHQEEDIWNYSLAQYKLLNQKQREAIAEFLSYLPNLLPLSVSHKNMVGKALESYWKSYLPKSYTYL